VGEANAEGVRTGGGVSVTLFLLCDAGGKNPNVILIGRDTTSASYETPFPHSQNCVAFLYDTEQVCDEYSCYDNAYM
jgi:hypothetical protein